MVVGTAKIRLHLPWVHSLKEKRMLVKSVLARLQNKYHVSAAEVGEQDIHQIAVLGVAVVSTDAAFVENILQQIAGYIEDTTEAQVTDIETELI